MRTPKRYTYYFRDPKTNAPMITVILIDLGENVYRGVSVCSERDNPNKKEGKAIAVERAIAAMFTREDATEPVIRFEPEDALWNAAQTISEVFGYKAERNPSLTCFEEFLLKGKEEE